MLYALLVRPDLFDTFLSASPALYWNDGYILQPSQLEPLTTQKGKKPKSKPAFQLSYGALEQFPVKRRTETQEEYETRKSFYQTVIMMSTNSNRLYNSIKNSTRLRDVSLHEYPFSDHAAVGGAALADGIDYFLDW